MSWLDSQSHIVPPSLLSYFTYMVICYLFRYGKMFFMFLFEPFPELLFGAKRPVISPVLFCPSSPSLVIVGSICICISGCLLSSFVLTNCLYSCFSKFLVLIYFCCRLFFVFLVLEIWPCAGISLQEIPSMPYLDSFKDSGMLITSMEQMNEANKEGGWLLIKRWFLGDSIYSHRGLIRFF